MSTLTFTSALDAPTLLAQPTAQYLQNWHGKTPVHDIRVAAIDPDLADTAAFCEKYGIGLDESANCVIVQAKREGKTWLAACVILATTRADVNKLARKTLGASKLSFAPMNLAVAETSMEYGGITPFGLPADWPILIDSKVAAHPRVIVGSGLRASKISTPGQALAELPNATILENLGL